MKKSAIALAVAGMVAAPLAAMADTTVYGSARVSETYTNQDKTKAVSGNQTLIKSTSNWDVRNESSRLGFRGSEDLGNGLAAIYHYEFGVDAADTAQIGGTDVGGRLAYVGLKGGFGQLTIGRQWNPYYFAVGGEVDVFNGINSGNGYYANFIPGESQTRTGNLLVYQTPDWRGLTLSGAIETNGSNTDAQGISDSDNIDAYQVAAVYDNGPLFLGAGYRNVSEDTMAYYTGNPGEDSWDQYGIQARWNIGAFGIAGSWQGVDDGDDTTNGYDAVGSFDFGNNRIRLGYFDVQDTVNGWIVGLQHNLSKRSRLWIEYGDNNYDGTEVVDGVLANVPDVSNVSIGMRHDF